MRFVDHYEALQLSPNANTELVERVYRILAKRYHPDNQDTGDGDKFAEILDAYKVLSDPEKRAAYDASYEGKRDEQWEIVRQAVSDDGRNEDRRILDGILSLLYVARRRDPHGGGLGAVNLERMLGQPKEHLAFPMWYLKQHGYIETLDSGQYAITVTGIDSLNGKELKLPTNRLLPESSVVGPTSPSRPSGRIPQEVG